MAHGSKKWITCYDGSIKKSNDRTRKDYYRGLKYWDVDSWYVVRGGRGRNKPANNCPQCKHVRKQVLDNQKEHDKARAEVRAEWEKKYGNVEYITVEKKNAKRPWYISRKRWFGGLTYTHVHFYTYFQEHRKYVPVWKNDWRNYVCFKCESKLDVKDEMWRYMPHRRGYGDQQKEYRNTVRNIIQSSKYEEDLDEAFEKIPVFKYDGWRD